MKDVQGLLFASTEKDREERRERGEVGRREGEARMREKDRQTDRQTEKFLNDKDLRPWHTACPCKSPLQTDKQN